MGVIKGFLLGYAMKINKKICKGVPNFGCRVGAPGHMDYDISCSILRTPYLWKLPCSVYTKCCRVHKGI